METRPKLLTIQVLRGIAASMVALGHAMIEVPKLAGFAGPVTTFNHGFGVDIFFAISGFIMMYTAGEGFGSAAGRKKFVLARLTRIVPIYWLLTTAVLAITLMAPAIFNSPTPTLQVLFGSYFFLPVPNAVGEAQPILAVGWTLNYEMMFYTLFALAMFLPRRLGAPILLGLLALLAIVGAVIRPGSVMLAFWTNSIILEFGFGIAIALICPWLARASRQTGVALMAAGFAFFVAMHFGPDTAQMPRFVINGIPAAVIVVGGVICDLRHRSIAIAPLILLGDASYSLYLSHMFSVRGVRIAWNILHLPPVAPLFCLAAFVVAVIVGLALALSFELPLHRFARRRLSGIRVSVPTPAPIEVAREPS